MKFLYYDLTFLLIFSLAVGIFLFKRRKNLKVESKVFVLYRTRVGLKFIEWAGTRFKKAFRIFSYIIIAAGYILMLAAIMSFWEILRMAIKMPELLKLAKVPPIMPLIPYLPEIFKLDYLPPFYFTYWIVAIAIIAVCHEFAHGVLARHYNVKIKSTGFGFLGPFLAAFVEPDEKQLAKKSSKAQIAVLSAGSFANAVVAIAVISVMLLFFYGFFAPHGVIFGTYSVAVNISSITSVSNLAVNNLSVSEFSSLLGNSTYIDSQIKMDNETANLTKIYANKRLYFAVTENLMAQIKAAEKKKTEEILVFEDTPAFNGGMLYGAITKINGVQVRNLKEARSALSNYKPNNQVIIETTDNNFKAEYYKITLAENPENKSLGYLGVSYLELKSGLRGITGFIWGTVAKFKDPNIFYKPKYNVGMTIFIYNLLWWVIMINVSVAVVNMLPLGVFDGGRVFYLTALAITKSKKKAAWLFKAVTFIILLLLLLLTVLWWLAL